MAGTLARKALGAAFALGLLASLTACTRGSRDLEAWVAEVKARPAPPLEPLPVMRQFETFEYAAQNLRDPFSKPDAGADGSNGLRPDPNRRKEILEAFPLDSLDMVGTIGSGDGIIGLVMGPDKVTYRVRAGNYMGLSDGRVTGVFDDRLEMVELVPDGAGGWLERQAKIALEDN
ncbi:MAG: pilus assembly protein PilP [Arenimonas sp.]|nr:pilus assembly protein PilP [Arenimonas sp.]MBP6626254.1 pilus assembly protein PilP [Arenimonas sp.]